MIPQSSVQFPKSGYAGYSYLVTFPTSFAWVCYTSLNRRFSMIPISFLRQSVTKPVLMTRFVKSVAWQHSNTDFPLIPKRECDQPSLLPPPQYASLAWSDRSRCLTNGWFGACSSTRWKALTKGKKIQSISLPKIFLVLRLETLPRWKSELDRSLGRKEGATFCSGSTRAFIGSLGNERVERIE